MKVALISGSSKGIGAEIATQLINENYIVYISGQNINSCKKLATTLGPNCFYFCGDLTQSSAIKSFIKLVLKQHKRIDLCVANLGSGASMGTDPISMHEYERLFQLNFFSTVELIQTASQHMDPSGHCIAIASITGVEAISGAPIPYSCAKSALITFIKTFSNHIASKGIRINSISPGNVLTEGGTWDKKMQENPTKTKAYISSHVPLNTFVNSIDIANTVLYLENASSITGSNIIIDAGQTSTLR